MSGATYIIGVLQVKAYRALQQRVSEHIKKFGLNSNQWFILGYIKEAEQAHAADIAIMLRVEPPLITTLTEDLVNIGLIKKVPDSTDKRAKLLCLTAKSKKLIPEVEQSLLGSLEELLAGVNQAELKTYEKTLRTIVENSQSRQTDH